MSNAPRLTYKPQLDALRAIATLAVMAEHFPRQELIPWQVFQLGYIGVLGVLLFFVLSGYLITGILLSSRASRFDRALKRFYLRRTLRIFPIYLLTLLILFVIGLPSVTGFIFWHALYVSNVLFVLQPQVAAPIAHLWSLSVEEQFYLVWPLLILVVPYKNLIRVILGSISIGICWKALVIGTVGDHLAGGLAVFSCLDSLALGALLAYIEQDEGLRLERQNILSGLLATGSVVILTQAVLFMTDSGRGLVLVTSYLGPSLVFVWVVGRAAAGFKGWFGAVLDWSPLRYLGKISYGVYLYHYFMPRVIESLIKFFGFAQPGNLSAALLAFLLTLLAAALSWHLVEKPISDLKDKLSER
jgi:peptidoglycan/LPS O-acetylase OafA/YrhL